MAYRSQQSRADERPAARGRPRAPTSDSAQGRMLALQRAAGNRAVAELLSVQRYNEEVRVTGMGSSRDPSRVRFSSIYAQVFCMGPDGPMDLTPGLHIGFEDGRVATLTLPEGATGGRVRLSAMVGATVVNILVDDHPWLSWDGSVPFSVVGKAITFGSPLADSESGGSGASGSVGVGSGQTTGGGYAAFTVSLSASGSTSLGGGVGVGPISASAPVSGSVNFAGGASRTFTVNLRVTPPQPIAGPDVDFRVGRATLADGQEGSVSAWFRGLAPGVQDGIRNGSRTVTISGYASTTARRRRNRDLSEQRARVAERILRGFAGSGATINVFYFGEDAATTPDEAEDATWRRVTIAVQAPSAAAPTVPGPVP